MLRNRLVELREQNGMTQQQLAALCEVSRQTIISLENRRYQPSLFLAHKLAVIFGLSIEEIFIFEEE